MIVVCTWELSPAVVPGVLGCFCEIRCISWCIAQFGLGDGTSESYIPETFPSLVIVEDCLRCALCYISYE
jgi:hypothetical protein